jgi:hypothetical protein
MTPPPPLPGATGNSSWTFAPRYLCPDLLSIRDIGAADGWRGHLVRGFFLILKKVTGV